MRHASMLWGNVKYRNGLSAYEVAVLNGFVGTEVEWLASLVGETGAQGPAGADGAPGTPGADGVDAYVYVAYASDNAGTGFSLTPTDALKYRAEIHPTSPLTPPVAADFADATWVKYLGDDGTGGGGSDIPKLRLDFEEAGDEFVYNVPYDMKFTSQVSENGDATLSIPLDTVMPMYTKLTVTATATGLVSLFGEYVTI